MNAITKTQFRAALVFSMILGVLGFIAFRVGESDLPALLREHLQRQRNAEPTAMDWAALVLCVLVLVAGIASFIGMLKFSRWSRPLAIATSVVTWVLFPLLGPTVEPGISTALYGLANMLYGAMVGIAYCSPAATWFEKELPPNKLLQSPSGTDVPR